MIAMAEDCPFCGDIPSEVREDLPDTELKEYAHWTVLLNFNQYYLGRCLVVLDRHAVDMLDLRQVEREELFEAVVPELKAAVQGCFDPDLFNYASLGNEVRHLHLHVIPRYAAEREFAGFVFEDENWGEELCAIPRGV